MRSPSLSILVLAAALAGCSSLKVNTEYDTTAPFATYRSYAWLASPPGPEQAPAIRNPIVREQVIAAVDREMARKGFVLTRPEASPDLLVSVHGWAQQRIEVTNYGYSYGGVYAYGPYRPMPVAVGAEVHAYTDGTMLIDFVDAKANRLVWRGTASDTFSSPDLAAVKRTVDEATRQLLEAYPPKPR